MRNICKIDLFLFCFLEKSRVPRYVYDMGIAKEEKLKNSSFLHGIKHVITQDKRTFIHRTYSLFKWHFNYISKSNCTLFAFRIHCACYDFRSHWSDIFFPLSENLASQYKARRALLCWELFLLVFQYHLIAPALFLESP